VKAGTSTLSSWKVTVSGVSVGSLWNGVATTSGSTTTVTNAPYNGAVAAGGSTTFGFIGSGTAGTPTLTCS